MVKNIDSPADLCHFRAVSRLLRRLITPQAPKGRAPGLHSGYCVLEDSVSGRSSSLGPKTQANIESLDGCGLRQVCKNLDQFKDLKTKFLLFE